MQQNQDRSEREQLKKALKDLGIPEPKSPEGLDREAVAELLPKESATEVFEREARERRERLEPPPPDVPDLSIYSDIKPFTDQPWDKRPDLVLAIILFCLGGVLAIALVLLPRESPGAIIFWLTIMFCLLAACELFLAHFLELSKFKCLAGLLIPAILVALFGWYIWPSNAQRQPENASKPQPSPLASTTQLQSIQPSPSQSPKQSPSPVLSPMPSASSATPASTPAPAPSLQSYYPVLTGNEDPLRNKSMPSYTPFFIPGISDTATLTCHVLLFGPFPSVGIGETISGVTVTAQNVDTKQEYSGSTNSGTVSLRIPFGYYSVWAKRAGYHMLSPSALTSPVNVNRGFESVTIMMEPDQSKE